MPPGRRVQQCQPGPPGEFQARGFGVDDAVEGFLGGGEVAAELETVKDQQFKTEAEFNKYLKEANFTLEEVTSRVRLQLLSQKIQDKITKSVSSVPDSDIENYYEGAEDEVTTAEDRDGVGRGNKKKGKQ